MIVGVFGLFRLKPEERVQAGVALVVIVLLNALFIWRLHELFLQPGFGPYWKVFEHELHLAGYDPLTYMMVTDWDVIYETHRHPLLAFLVWPLWLLNQGLTWLLALPHPSRGGGTATRRCDADDDVRLLDGLSALVCHRARPLYSVDVPPAADALYLWRVHPEAS